MRPILDQCCCLTSLRMGCYCIATYLIASATAYLVFHFLLNEKKDVGEDHKVKMIETTITYIGCAFSYIIAVVLIIGVCMDLLMMVWLSSNIHLLYTFFILLAPLVIWTIGHVRPVHLLLIGIKYYIYAAVQIYFVIVSCSYYLQRKEEECFLATLQEEVRTRLKQERVQAEQQGAPDPMKAAIRKYRKDLEESSVEDNGTTQPESTPVQMASQN